MEKNYQTASLAHGEYLRTHFKNMREVAAALSGVTCFNASIINPNAQYLMFLSCCRHETDESLCISRRR